MRVIAKRILREFWERHPQAEDPLRSWYAAAENADWQKPADIKQTYATASFLADNRVVFNVAGNRYRLVAKVYYDYGRVYIRFVGTHREYDRIDATTI
jgi:mRNA interferase HigB